jgi:hypothetical protein
MTALPQPQPLQVTHVRTSSTFSGYNYITDVMAGGYSWTRQQVIDQILYLRQYSFFTNVGGYSAQVIVVTERDGSQYIKTDADAVGYNNLLALPSF